MKEEMKEKTCGIYGIRNKVNGKIYVGQSIEIETRFIRHKAKLKCNKHINPHLQRSYKKHGLENFEFFIIEKCSKENLCIREQHWIDAQPKESLYNSKLFVEDCSGERNSFFGKKHSSESKEKMSQWKKANYVGKNNPNYGKKHPKSVGLKMRLASSQTKLTVDDVKKIVNLLREEISHQEIADQFNVSRTVVTRISNGTRWRNITGGPIFPIERENGKRKLRNSHKQRIGEKRLGKKHSEKSKQLMSQSKLNKKV